MKIILWREIKGELTAPITAVGHFVVPVFYVVFFAAAFGSNISQIAYKGLPFRYTEFFIPGLIALQTFTLFSWTFSMVRIDRSTNIVAVLLTSGIQPHVYFMGKMIAAIVVTLMRVIIVFVASLFLSYVTLPKLPHLGISLLGLVLGTIIWFSLGFVSGLFMSREDVRDIVFSILTLPITFTSSMYYNIELAPSWVRAIGMFNPLTYVVEVVRGGFLNLTVPTKTLTVLGLCSAVCVAIAFRSCKRLS
jgi:ABC-2 type transport system permease protein